MASDSESAGSGTPGRERPAASNWIKVGIFAAASALAGGLAAAWYYRGTLTRLQEAKNREPESISSLPPDDSDD